VISACSPLAAVWAGFHKFDAGQPLLRMEIQGVRARAVGDARSYVVPPVGAAGCSEPYFLGSLGNFHVFPMLLLLSSAVIADSDYE
jgi:hypothetical protein